MAHIDGQGLEVFEAQPNPQLDRLQRELKEDAYQPPLVRQHPISRVSHAGHSRDLPIAYLSKRAVQDGAYLRADIR
jgi:hypothetical protein